MEKGIIKNKFLFMLFSLIVGIVCGVVIWAVLKIISLGITFLWEFIPKKFEIPFYTIIVCTIGGLIIGLWQKKFGDYPKKLEKIKENDEDDEEYNYKKVLVVSVSTILPLIFGGSVGPEAGLIGIVKSICTWIGQKIKMLTREIKEITNIGISATLGVIFKSPLFGFIEPMENDKESKLSSSAKIVTYILAIIGALGIFVLLNHLIGEKTVVSKFYGYRLDTIEMIYLIPIAIIGVIFGFIYTAFRKGTKKIAKPLEDKVIIRCLISGLILGIMGYFLPYVMFSGEHQIPQLVKEWSKLGLGVLIVTGIVKLLVTNTCIEMGFKGGQFFPLIFSGVILGYSVSLILGINATFTVAILTAGLLSYVIKKSLATTFLLMILFPVDAIVPILIASIIGTMIPIPKMFEEKKSELI